MPLVVDMPKTWRMQAPEAVVRRGAGAGEQLPVPQHGNQVRGRRRKRVKSPVRLQDAPTHSASERGVVNTEPGKGRTAGGSAAACECIWDIHSAMLAVPLGVRHLVAALCGELAYVTSGTFLGSASSGIRANPRFLPGYSHKRLPPVTLGSRAAAL